MSHLHESNIDLLTSQLVKMSSCLSHTVLFFWSYITLGVIVNILKLLHSVVKLSNQTHLLSYMEFPHRDAVDLKERQGSR